MSWGDVVIGFSGTSTTQYVSGYVAIGETTGGVTTFGAPMMTIAGVDDYEVLDSADPPRNRWGDYSATSLDPTDSQVFWTIQEFVSAVDVWSTQITQIILGIEPDSLESNDSLATATVLGSLPEVTLQDLSIHDANDEDWFRITANQTGKLVINAIFADSPGDGEGDLDIYVHDSAGNVIASSTTTDSNEQIVIPAVGQQTYYLQVIGVGDDVNEYDLEIENFAAPVPDSIVLDPTDDTGSSNSDNVTNEALARIFIEADLAEFASEGIDILTPAEVAAGDDGGGGRGVRQRHFRRLRDSHPRHRKHPVHVHLRGGRAVDHLHPGRRRRRTELRQGGRENHRRAAGPQSLGRTHRSI